MKIKRNFFVLLALLLMACATVPKSDAHSVLDQSAVPTRGLRFEDDHLGEYLEIPVSGKVTILHFLVFHSEPCFRAISGLESIWQRVDRDRVLIIAVFNGEDDVLARKTIKDAFPVQVTFPMVYDRRTAELQRIYKVSRFPSTFLVDKQGRVRFYFDGSTGDMELLEQAITALMNE